IKKIKSSNVIQPGNMVLMRMSEENGIHIFYVLPQHLVAKVRRCVYNNRCIRGLYHDARTQSLIFFVGRRADLAIAGDHRDPAACPGAKKSYFESGISHG